MPNAALELADLLEAWKVAPEGTSVAGLRGQGGSAEDAQVRAAQLFAEVKRSIDALEAQGEDVRDHRLWLPDWFAAVFVPSHDWNITSGSKPLIEAKAVGALRTLGRYLDKSGFRTLPATTDSLVRARASVREVVDVLHELDLDDATAHYLFMLVDEVRSLLDAEAAEVTVDLIRRVNELRGALDGIADRVEVTEPENEAPSKLRAAGQWLLPIAVRGAIAIDMGFNTAANYLQVTQGAAH